MRVLQTAAVIAVIGATSLFSQAAWSQAELLSRSGLTQENVSAQPSAPAAPNATLTEGFEGTFPPTGWLVRNQSTTIGTNVNCWNVFTGLTPWGARSGNGHTGANFNCTTGANTISGWLLSSQISGLANGDQVSFWSRKSAGATDFPDRLELRLCLDGAPNSCGAVGSTGTLPTDVGSFTTLVLSINPTLVTGVYPNVYTQFSATLSGLPVGPNNGRLGFRYFVTSGGPGGANSDIISIDDVSVSTPAGDTAPTLTYNPTTAAGVTFPGGAAGSVNASIAISSIGASGTGQTAVTGCAITGPGAASFGAVTTTPAGGVFNTGTTAGSINLSCTRGASAASASLACTETATPTVVGSPFTRTWALTCPAAGASNVAPVAAIAATTTLTGGTGTVTPTIVTPAQGTGSTNFACSIPATAPSNFLITTNANQTITTTTLGIGLTCVPQAAATSATLTCTQTATPGPNPANATALITCPAAAVASCPLTNTLSVTDPTYNRSGTFLQGGTCTLSGAGTAVRYKAIPITLIAASNVTASFLTADGGSITPAGADTFLTLYGPGGFNPAAACTNAITANDDSPSPLSRIATTTPLAAGSYTLVVTSFSNVPGGAGPLPWNYTLAVTPANACVAVVVNADLAATLTDTPDPVNAGTNLSYTATATNNGPDPAAAVSISLPLPAGTTFVSATPSAGGICNAASPVVCNWAAPTATGAANARSVVVVASVPASTAAATVFNATTTVASTTNDSTAGNNTAVATTTVGTSADVSVILTDSPDPVTAGSNLTYTATATNNGPSDAQGVNISLPLPAGTSFVSATPSVGGNCAGTTTVTCTWAGATAPAGVVTATIVASVAPATIGTLNATVTAAASTTDGAPGNNMASATTAVTASADLSITLTDSPDPVTAGSNLTYTATVSNAGPSDATGVTVTLPLPIGTSLVSGSVSGGGSCAGSPVVCTVTGSIASGAPRTATIVVAVAPSVLNGTVLSATATVGSSSTDPNAANNSVSTTTTVSAIANLALTFTASATQTALGTPVIFSASSQNLGPSNAQDVNITITLSPTFRYSSHNPSAGAICTTPQVGTSGPISCTWTGSTAVNAVRTLTVTAFSNSPGISSVQAATSSPTADPVPANNLSSQAVAVGDPAEPIPSLSENGLILLGLLFGLLGLVAVRRQN